MTVLLVEHSDYLATIVAETLQKAGFEVDVVPNAAEAATALAAVRFELMLFDMDVPDSNDLALLRIMRERRNLTPVILIGANESLHPGSFEVRPNDYLSKPLALNDLVARVRLNRSAARGPVATLSLENLVLDVPTQQVIVDDRARNFSTTEIALLTQLLQHSHRVVPRESLARRIYGDADSKPNAMEAHVHRLRKRLRDAGAHVQIQTVRRIGYLLEAAS
jgi:DNA-binding response OmpR family regulator